MSIEVDIKIQLNQIQENEIEKKKNTDSKQNI